MEESKRKDWHNRVTSKVKEHLYHNASEYFRCDDKIAFLIPGVVSMMSIGSCRFRYWQVLPYNSTMLMLVVYKKL